MLSRSTCLILLLWAAQTPAAELPAPFQDFGGSLHARLNRYDIARFNTPLDRASGDLGSGRVMLSLGDSRWQVDRTIRPAAVDATFDCVVIFECLSGELHNASVSVDFGFTRWKPANYLLLPAAVYNGNRYEAVRMDYSPFFIERRQLGLDHPPLLSDHPRLNYREGLSRLQDRSGSLAVPAVGFYSPSQGRNFWLLFNQATPWGDYGVDFEENADRTKAVATLTAPVVREVERHWFTRMDAKPSTDRPAHFKAGDRVEIRFTIDLSTSSRIQDLYTRLLQLRQHYYPAPIRPKLLPHSEAVKILETRHNRENWRSEGYYATGVGSSLGQDWQPGWTGGLIMTHALAAQGSADTRRRVEQTLDWLYPAGLSPSGYYYDLRHEGRFMSAKDPKPFGRDLTLVRKNADATYYAFKQFDLFRKLGLPMKATWQEGNLHAVRAQLDTWKRYGRLGQFLNQQTGELVVGNSTSAGLFPAALCAAYGQTGEATFLAAAREIGEYYYANYTTKGLTYGGPGDALQSFDSESAYALVESYTELHEATGEAIWLTRAEEAAEQFASWVMAYDFKYPANTSFARLDIRTNGLVWANSQNKTACPSICTHSGLALLKLYRATGKPVYLDLLRDITLAITQFMSWPGRPIPNYHDGWIFERGGTSDWLEGIGEGEEHCSFPGCSLMLAAAELPGIYVDSEAGRVFVLDHMEAGLVETASGRQLKITNPTPYDATCRVLIESDLGRKQPLNQNSFLGWKQITIAPRGEAVIPVATN